MNRREFVGAIAVAVGGAQLMAVSPPTSSLKGQWVYIEYHATPDVFRMWVNHELVVHRTGMRFNDVMGYDYAWFNSETKEIRGNASGRFVKVES